MDCGVGKVLETVGDLNREDDTLVVFVGDNGGYRDTSNGELRGQKGRLFEGGIRVPFIFAWPGRLPRGKTFDHPVMHIDILPSVLAAAGRELPKNLDGKNLLPLLEAERAEPPHDVLFWGRGDRFAIRKGPWKLVRERGPDGSPTEPCLFHLKEDAAEQNDLAPQQEELVRQLLESHRRWQSQRR
jgi:arylsulfatase A-like enzyme